MREYTASHHGDDLSYRVATTAMMTTNVDDKASGVSARHVALHESDDELP